MRKKFSHHKSIVPRKNVLRANFRKSMFWDVDMDQLSQKAEKAFIIDRVLSYNMENPLYLEQLEKLYQIRDIKNIAKSSRSIRGNEAIRFLANRYGMDLNSFKQYIPNL